MIDLHLFLPRTLKNVVPDGQRANPMEVYYGSIPQHILDTHVETARSTVDVSSELVSRLLLTVTLLFWVSCFVLFCFTTTQLLTTRPTAIVASRLQQRDEAVLEDARCRVTHFSQASKDPRLVAHSPAATYVSPSFLWFWFPPFL